MYLDEALINDAKLQTKLIRPINFGHSIRHRVNQPTIKLFPQSNPRIKLIRQPVRSMCSEHHPNKKYSTAIPNNAKH